MARADYSWVGDVGSTLSTIAFKIPEFIELDKRVKNDNNLKAMAHEGFSTALANMMQSKAVVNTIKQEGGFKDEMEVAQYLKKTMPAPQKSQTNEEYTKQLANGVKELGLMMGNIPVSVIRDFYDNDGLPSETRLSLAQMLKQGKDYEKVSEISKKATEANMSPSDYKRLMAEGGYDINSPHAQKHLAKRTGAFSDEFIGRAISDKGTTYSSLYKEAFANGLDKDPRVLEALEERRVANTEQFATKKFATSEEADSYARDNGIDLNSKLYKDVFSKAFNTEYTKKFHDAYDKIEDIRKRNEGFTLEEAYAEYFKEFGTLSPELQQNLKYSISLYKAGRTGKLSEQLNEISANKILDNANDPASRDKKSLIKTHLGTLSDIDKSYAEQISYLGKELTETPKGDHRVTVLKERMKELVTLKAEVNKAKSDIDKGDFSSIQGLQEILEREVGFDVNKMVRRSDVENIERKVKPRKGLWVGKKFRKQLLASLGEGNGYEYVEDGQKILRYGEVLGTIEGNFNPKFIPAKELTEVEVAEVEKAVAGSTGSDTVDPSQFNIAPFGGADTDDEVRQDPEYREPKYDNEVPQDTTVDSGEQYRTF